MDKQDPIVRKSLQDNAIDWLRREIVHGRLQPGEVLTEIALAQQMGVGRGTVRSALFALEAQELVVRSPYLSCHVAPLDAEIIWEIYTLREALECLAARIYVSRRTPLSRERLNQAFDGLAKAEKGDMDSRVEADLRYHRTLVDATSHGHLNRRHKQLQDKMEWLYRWSEGHWPQREPLVSGHQALHDALIAGDEDRAEAMTRQHIRSSLEEDLQGFAGLSSDTQR